MASRIIIFSGKQYSGKDTLAGLMLKEMTNFKRFAMGDIIKLTYGAQHGLSYEEIEQNKSKYRPELIKLGNQGREKDPDFWLKKIISQDGNIFVTDVRMLHEYEVFKKAGAVSIRVEAQRETRASRGELVNENDVTETELDNITDWNYVVHNDAGIEELTKIAHKLVKELY